MLDSDAPANVGQKSAQMGYTVTMMNRAFYMIDIRRESVLYLLPSKTPDATDFSATKFDPALEISPNLAKLFSDVSNVGTKRAGSAVLYIRGSNSRVGLKSISVSEIIFDEFDEMNMDNIPLAEERMSGQTTKQTWKISTPRFPGVGINSIFNDTTKEHFFFKCPLCDKQIELLEENLVICGTDLHDPDIKRSHIICTACNGKLTDPDWTEEAYREAKATMLQNGVWVPTGHNDFDHRGFYINQLYSPTIYPYELAQSKIKAITSKAAEQEFYNSKLGTAHEVDGARVTEDVLKQSVKSHSKIEVNVDSSKLVTMGVDVGTWMHIEIAMWDVKRLGNDINIMSDCIVLWEGKRPMTSGMTELDELMRRYRVYMAVIDQQPERASAIAFARRFWGHAKVCFFANSMSGKSLSIDTTESDFRINVDRTMWLDIALGRFHNWNTEGAPKIQLPHDTSLEYRAHMRNIARVYEEDREGNPVGRYISNGDDHFAFARCYNEIALPLAAAVSTGNSDIGAFL